MSETYWLNHGSGKSASGCQWSSCCRPAGDQVVSRLEYRVRTQTASDRCLSKHLLISLIFARRATHHRGLKRVLAGNYQILDKREKKVAQTLLAGGRGYLLANWPRAGAYPDCAATAELAEELLPSSAGSRQSPHLQGFEMLQNIGSYRGQLSWTLRASSHCQRKSRIVWNRPDKVSPVHVQAPMEDLHHSRSAGASCRCSLHAWGWDAQHGLVLLCPACSLMSTAQTACVLYNLRQGTLMQK